jgi:acyl carrier protein phosphodiesterase
MTGKVGGGPMFAALHTRNDFLEDDFIVSKVSLDVFWGENPSKVWKKVAICKPIQNVLSSTHFSHRAPFFFFGVVFSQCLFDKV